MCPECGGDDGIAVDEDNDYDDEGNVVGSIYEIHCTTAGCDGIWVEGDDD